MSGWLPAAIEARPASPGHRFLGSGNQWACLPLDMGGGLSRLMCAGDRR